MGKNKDSCGPYCQLSFLGFSVCKVYIAAMGFGVKEVLRVEDRIQSKFLYTSTQPLFHFENRGD
jgi:hypothetical protein